MKLAESPDLRLALGAAGQQRAQDMPGPRFRLYRDLFVDLADRRSVAHPDEAAAERACTRVVVAICRFSSFSLSRSGA